MKHDEMIAQELAEGFDRDKAEDALQKYMEAKLGGGIATYESRVAGVIAMERLNLFVDDQIDWDAFAEVLKAEVGVPVACIANCDWTFDDQCDEEATYIAFDILSLDDSYRDENRSLLSLKDDEHTNGLSM